MYRVLLASSEKGKSLFLCYTFLGIEKEYEFEGATFIVQKGDYSPLMAGTIEHLKRVDI